MAKLTGKEIIKQVEAGNITIEDFDLNRVNPNSYNLRLAPELKVYKKNGHTEGRALPGYENIREGVEPCVVLDCHKVNETEDLIIPEEGLVLMPGVLYLGRTMEKFHTSKYVPTIDGRSSIGRLGASIHITAGFGDIGFDGTWTLEITVVHRLRVYAGDEICQMSFETCEGDMSYQYNGRYNGQIDVTASRFNEDKKGAYKE